MTTPVLAIDFGTSNSAAAVLDGGKVVRQEIEPGAGTLPTAVFLEPGVGAMRIGTAAAAALIAGDEGRYMRALKSVLGTTLLHEPRLIAGRRRTLAQVVTAFLAQLKARAEAAAGQRFDRVLSGRPVHFHSGAPDRDAQAQADLRACYLAAGFAEVAFCPEPEAAALDRVWIVFDGADAAALEVARDQWRGLTGAGSEAEYWSEEAGRWQMKTARRNPA